MEQQSLFGNRAGQDMPLATRMRPRTLEEFAGQRHLLGKGKVLRQLIEEDRVSSMIFWGPPGVGKTSVGKSIAEVQVDEFSIRDHAHTEFLSTKSKRWYWRPRSSWSQLPLQ